MQNKGGKRLAGGPEGDHPANLPQDAPQPDAPQKSKARKLWDDYGYMVITLAVVFVVLSAVGVLPQAVRDSSRTAARKRVKMRFIRSSRMVFLYYAIAALSAQASRGDRKFKKQES